MIIGRTDHVHEGVKADAETKERLEIPHGTHVVMYFPLRLSNGVSVLGALLELRATEPLHMI